MSGCHHDNGHQHSASIDWLLWGSLSVIIILYTCAIWFNQQISGIDWLATMAHTVHSLLHTMWWGVVIGIIMVSLLSRIPRDFIMRILGRGGSLSGILRATFAGVLLDLCSHGILMVGAKLYERGASVGQVIAFLLASPWNSFSLTLILIALIGLPWTLAFILLSMIIAILTGVFFDRLVMTGTLPENPDSQPAQEDFAFWKEARKRLGETSFSALWFVETAKKGLHESRMVLRWLFVGILLAAILRASLDVEQFEQYFGPSLIGLSFTILFATVLEVCSEGSAPIASDILNRAHAPGNGFAFLMAGVATDYTEIMVMKDTTRSWKIALFIPLITLPQVIVVAWLMNQFSAV